MVTQKQSIVSECVATFQIDSGVKENFTGWFNRQEDFKTTALGVNMVAIGDND